MVASDERGQRQDASAESLAQYEHVRHNSEVFAGEHGARSTQCGRNFVEDQQRAMSVAGRAYALPIVGARNVRRAANRFGNNGRDIALVSQDIFDIFGALQVATATQAAIPKAT